LVGFLDPLIVKGYKLKNRIVMPPMQTGLATTKGKVTKSLITHYVRRCEALGLLIVEHSYVTLDGRFSERQLGIYDDNLISGLKQLSRSIHMKDTPVVIQINHAGRSASQDIIGMQPVAPSKIGNARKLTIEEIEVLIEAFAKAAERAMKAGFDGVEVHGAHGFLLNQFSSPLVNKRKDDYGETIENRMRFPLEVVKRVKERISGRLILYRLGSVDIDQGGTHIEDSQKFALKLQEAGVDIIDVSGGLCGSRPIEFQGKQGFFIPQAQEIKKVIDIPVIGVGGIKEPDYANKIIQEGRVDLVAVGRSLFKDNNWATKAVKGLSA
jgi:2,4-dienoyl-CoA reductase-like NADH-dependent reductase (Old Yellow Enzyme family)